MVYNNIVYLTKIKKSIKYLPDRIWDSDDLQSSNYKEKRKKLIESVMHIDNKISNYVIKKYGDTSSIYKEFQSYSFFPPNGIRFEDFNVANNEYWGKGKKVYLVFVDKLIDFAKADMQYASIDLRINILKCIILLLVTLLAIFLLFTENNISNSLSLYAEGAIKKGFLVAILSIFASLLLWIKKWMILLPVLVAVIIGFFTI